MKKYKKGAASLTPLFDVMTSPSPVSDGLIRSHLELLLWILTLCCETQRLGAMIVLYWVFLSLCYVCRFRLLCEKERRR